MLGLSAFVDVLNKFIFLVINKTFTSEHFGNVDCFFCLIVKHQFQSQLFTFSQICCDLKSIYSKYNELGVEIALSNYGKVFKVTSN